MSDDTNDLLKQESKELYDADTAKYFRNVGGTQTPGMSADDLAVADKHLPALSERAKYADRLERGFSKTSRSGAYSKPGVGPAIFPNSMKFASEFIDEMSPGKYKPEAPMKPPPEQKKATGHFPKPSAVVDICIDCLEQLTPAQTYVLGMTIVTEEDSQARLALRLKYGDLVLYNVCTPCFDAAKEIARDKRSLALVFGGSLIPESEVKLAIKYGFPLNLHDGTEKSWSQWEMVKRQQRVMDNLWSYIRNQAPDSPIYRNANAEKGN